MLREAAASVLSQTHKELELIIVLNAATAEAMTAAQSIVASDTRVRLAFIDKGSLPAARNVGLNAALGDWVAFLDDDDLWMPQKIEQQLKEANTSGADLIACEVSAFNKTGAVGVISSPLPSGLSLREAMTVYNYLPGAGSGALIRTISIRALGGFDERMRACEDWDMWRRMLWDSKVIRMPQTLALRRMHDTNMVHRNSLMVRAEFWHLVKATTDTPRSLRHVLLRAWRDFVLRNIIGPNLSSVYKAALFVDRNSGGWLMPSFRYIRSTIRNRSLQR